MIKNICYKKFMIKNLKWETIVSVIVIIVIISIVLISMIKIIEYDNNLNFEYDKINYTSLLENNTKKLTEKIHTWNLITWTNYFLYKNNNEIKVFSGTLWEDYKYINYLWEHINSWSYKWAIYARECFLKNDIFECSIKEMIKK